MNRPSVILAADEGRRLQVLADRVRVLATGEQTDHRYELFVVEGDEGSGPPPHAHPWDEAFFVLEGVVELWVDGRRLRADAGAFALAPADTVHSFRIASPHARFVVVTSGGTASASASALFEALDREIGFPPPSLDAVGAIAARQGVRLADAPATAQS